MIFRSGFLKSNICTRVQNGEIVGVPAIIRELKPYLIFSQNEHLLYCRNFGLESARMRRWRTMDNLFSHLR